MVDVAGGRGALSFELSLEGVECTLVESREGAISLDRKQRKRMRRVEGEAEGGKGREEGELPFAVVRESFDEAFAEKHESLLNSCSLLVGLHPDEVRGRREGERGGGTREALGGWMRDEGGRREQWAYCALRKEGEGGV